MPGTPAFTGLNTVPVDWSDNLHYSVTTNYAETTKLDSKQYFSLPPILSIFNFPDPRLCF